MSVSKSGVLATAAVLILSATEVASATGPQPTSVVHGKAHRFITAATGSVTLRDQNGNDTSSALISQDYASPDYDSYDSQGADDFTVPAGHKWNIKEVDVTGQGSAASENVFFYRNKNGLPGKLLAACRSLIGTNNGTGSFVIKIPRTCPVHLTEGKYWVSVQVNQNVSGGFFEWHWEENAVRHGRLAAWQNYGFGNAYGVCQTWGSDCFHHGTDFMFALQGIDTVL